MSNDKDRLEREIEEILGKIEEFPSASERRARQRKRAVGRLGASVSSWPQRQLAALSRIDMSQVMLLSFMLILGSFFLRAFSPLIMQWVLYAGVVLFVAAFAMLLMGRRGGRGDTRYWRGKPIEYRQPSMGDLARRWFGSGRRKQ